MTLIEMQKRADNLHRHVQEHPADYNAVIAEIELRSKIIDKTRKESVYKRLKEVSRIAKERAKHEEQRQ